MRNNGRDLERMLEAEILYHEQKLARAKRALRAYRGMEDTTTPPARPRQQKPGVGLPWSESIDKVLQRLGTATLAQIREGLADMGLPAHENKYRNAIFQAAARKARVAKNVKKIRRGVYKWVGPPPEQKNEGASSSHDDGSLLKLGGVAER